MLIEKLVFRMLLSSNDFTELRAYRADVILIANSLRQSSVPNLVNLSTKLFQLSLDFDEILKYQGSSSYLFNSYIIALLLVKLDFVIKELHAVKYDRLIDIREECIQLYNSLRSMYSKHYAINQG